MKARTMILTTMLLLTATLAVAGNASADAPPVSEVPVEVGGSDDVTVQHQCQRMNNPSGNEWTEDCSTTTVGPSGFCQSSYYAMGHYDEDGNKVTDFERSNKNCIGGGGSGGIHEKIDLTAR